MPRFCANLSLLFTEHAFLDRFEAAARAGFKAVEYQFPYEFDKDEVAKRAKDAGVEVVLFNLPSGDWDKGERGIACLSSRMSEFRDGVGRAISYAKAVDCKRINMLSGIAESRTRLSEISMRQTFISNLRYASRELDRAGIVLMVEPLNTRTVPGVYLRNSAQALSLIDEADVKNAKLQYDIFHMQMMEGDLANTIAMHLARIGHIQIADVPDRHEPGTGEVNFPWLFGYLDKIGYEGWIGAEYNPAGDTVKGLGWAKSYLGKKA
jgi:hydroxypyruvate isomerase